MGCVDDPTGTATDPAGLASLGFPAPGLFDWQPAPTRVATTTTMVAAIESCDRIKPHPGGPGALAVQTIGSSEAFRSKKPTSASDRSVEREVERRARKNAKVKNQKRAGEQGKSNRRRSHGNRHRSARRWLAHVHV